MHTSMDEVVRKNIIKGGWVANSLDINAPEYGINGVDPTGFAIGFEHKFDKRVSWGINLTGTGYSTPLAGLGMNYDANIFMISPQFRYYFTGQGLKGVYLASNLNLGSIELSQGSNSVAMGGYGFGLDLGYQWVSNYRWTA